MVASSEALAALLKVISARSGVRRLLLSELKKLVGNSVVEEASREGLLGVDLVGCAEHGSVTELGDGTLYCTAGGHVLNRGQVEVAEIDQGALVQAFGQQTGTRHRPDLSTDDLVLLAGNEFDFVVSLSDHAPADRPHELLGMHVLKGKPVKACVSDISVSQLEPFGIFGLSPASALALGPESTDILPGSVSSRTKLGGESWRMLYESFRDAGISPQLETMCAAVDEARALTDLARLAESGQKGIGTKVEQLLYFALRRVFPHCVPMNPEATGKELPDGYVFSVGSSKLCWFYDSKARLEEYSLVADERRKLDTYFERSLAALRTHDLVGGCLVSTDFDPSKVSSGARQLVAKHGRALALITYQGLQRLAGWDLHPVLSHLLRVVRQPEPDALLVATLLRPEALAATAGPLDKTLNEVRNRFVQKEPEWSALAGTRVVYWSPGQLLATVTAVALKHASEPTEAELERLGWEQGRPAISLSQRLRDGFPASLLGGEIDWSVPLQLEHGSILPLEAASIIATFLANTDAAYDEARKSLLLALAM